MRLLQVTWWFTTSLTTTTIFCASPTTTALLHIQPSLTALPSDDINLGHNGRESREWKFNGRRAGKKTERDWKRIRERDHKAFLIVRRLACEDRAGYWLEKMGRWGLHARMKPLSCPSFTRMRLDILGNTSVTLTTAHRNGSHWQFRHSLYAFTQK